MDKILGYQPVFTKGVVSNANCYTYISGSKNYIFKVKIILRSY